MAATDYRIDIQKLKDGAHQFRFQVDDAFFAGFPHTEVQGANVTADIALQKDNRQIVVNLHLDGELTLVCDRCSGDLDWPIFRAAKLIYSYDPSLKGTDEDEDITFIPRDLHYLDLRQDLYDYISLQVPLRKVPDAGNRHQCPAEVLAILAAGAEAAALQEATDGEVIEHEDPSQNDDPRWAALRQLRLGEN